MNGNLEPAAPGESAHDPFAGPAILTSAPSTESQREIWTGVQMGVQASLAFNESVSLRFRGPLDLAALRAGFQKLIERHESLRMNFGEDGTTLFVTAAATLEIPLTDHSALNPAEKTAVVKQACDEEVETPFELLQGRLVRARVLKLSGDEHVLIITCHHVICDGWSFAVLLYDLGALYAAERRGVPAALETAPSFSEFARGRVARASSEANQKAEAFWLKQFANQSPVLDLPLDRPRPPFKTYAALREDYALDAELVQAVRKTGAKAGCSLVHTLMAGFNVLLHRVCAHEDIVVGLPAAGQSAAELPGLVGHCVNTLPILSHLEGEQKFSDYLRSLKRTMLDAFDHQEFTYSSLLQKLNLKRDPSRLTLVSVLFNVDQKLDANKLGFPDVKVEFASNPRHYENFELFVNAVDAGGRLILEVQYNTDLFDAETIRRWMAMFESLLRGITQAPDGKIADLPLIPVVEQQRILVEWNATTAEYPRTQTVSEVFQARARLTPDRIAARFEAQTLTYRELDARSNQVARRLRGLGVEKGTLVGISVERSLEMLISMLGVLKAGGGYVPLDPAYPKDRLAYMLEHSQLPVLLTQSRLLAELPAFAGKTLLIDGDREEILQQSVEPIPQLADPESVAYVIYTSGSTGKPKGVMVPHRAVVNFLTSMARKPGITEKDVLVAVTTLSFDIAVLELYLPLTVGAEVVIASRDSAGDGNALKDLLHSSGATFMQATPATWRLLLEVGWKGSARPGEMFKVLAGGEAVPRDLINQVLELTDTVWNMYGPTETAVWSTCNPIRTRTGAVSIGRPIDNTQVYILDARLKPMPIGVAGELHIGGSGVTHGYLHRPDLTAERFIDNPFFNPFSTDLHAKLYKTGDLARLMADGNLEYVGRNDSQVKVRGYRIELGEIETILSQHPNVAQNVVMVREDRPGDVRLVAYAIAKPGLTVELADVRTHLRAALPEYMIPQNLVVLESFPRTNNGKIERKALPVPSQEGGSGGAGDDEFVAPRTPAETLLADLWKELIRVERVGVHDNFFNLGGHSLLSIQFISRLEKKTGQRLNPRLLLLNSLEQIALQLKVAGDGAQATGASAGAGTGAAATATGGISSGFVDKLKASFFGAKGDEAAPTTIPRRKTTGLAQASLMQERLLELDQQSPNSTVYNLPAAFRLQGELDIPAMQRSLGELFRRHEVLRGTLERTRKGAQQLIALPREVVLTPIDLSGVPEAEREKKIVGLLSAEAERPFDLARGPLVRVQLYKLSPQEHVLFFMPHHAVWDGWSFDLFLREMDTLYDAFRNGKPSPLRDLAFQYPDYAEWHRAHVKGSGLKRERDYWLRQLAGDLPVLNLPVDRPRPPVISFRGDMHEIKFPKVMMDGLTEMGRSEGATLNLVLLAAFTAFLYRLSGQRDLTIGVPVQGRSAPGAQDLIGYFVNTLVLRTKLPESAPSSFREVLRRVQEAQLDAFDHQEMPFEVLVRELELPKDPSRTPLYQAGFSFQDAMQRRTQFSNLKLGQFHLHPKGVPTDLTLWFKATPNGLTGAFEYSTDLFDASTMERFGREFEAVLKSVLASPDQSIFKKTEPAPVAAAPSPAAARSTAPTAPGARAARVLNKPMNPFFFESGGKRLFGIYHPARAQNARDTAVLLCNPMGQEYLRSHWALRQLTAQLVKAGFPVMRFDYFATGDSDGDSTAVSLAQWKADVRSAAAELQTVSGARKLSLVGLRLGAALAALNAEKDLALRDLVLWDPVVSGKRYLTDLTGLHSRLLAGGPYNTILTPEQIAATEQLMGFPVPLALRAEIEKIDLTALGPVKAERAWIIASTESDEFPRLQAAAFHPQLDYRLTPDGGDWNNLADAHGSLLAPRVVQAIVTAMTSGSKSP